ncbi:hypothetical protein QVD17_14366 [Tagetes erecta]|uniref:Uncharacterized protein n=1 Tax=Tagetes erecta TaxID=13708 RepID=A0AAD8P3R2_TARER|nr:hypothetical protein QVD17_14366 [Tagetes erecta]
MIRKPLLIRYYLLVRNGSKTLPLFIKTVLNLYLTGEPISKHKYKYDQTLIFFCCISSNRYVFSTETIIHGRYVTPKSHVRHPLTSSSQINHLLQIRLQKMA